MPRTTKSVSSGKERAKKWREIKKLNINEHQAYLLAERKRYRERKEAGKIKLIGELSKRAQRHQRKEWRTRKNISLKNKMLTVAATNILTDDDPSLPDATSSQSHRGRKKVRRDRSAAYRHIKKLEIKMNCMRRSIEKLRKRQRRKGLSNVSNSPATKVERLLKGSFATTPVKRTLLCHHSLVANLSERFTKCKEHDKHFIYFCTS